MLILLVSLVQDATYYLLLFLLQATLGVEAAAFASKLAAFYILRPTTWLLSLLGMARGFIAPDLW